MNKILRIASIALCFLLAAGLLNAPARAVNASPGQDGVIAEKSKYVNGRYYIYFADKFKSWLGGITGVQVNDSEYVKKPGLDNVTNSNDGYFNTPKRDTYLAFGGKSVKDKKVTIKISANGYADFNAVADFSTKPTTITVNPSAVPDAPVPTFARLVGEIPPIVKGSKASVDLRLQVAEAKTGTPKKSDWVWAGGSGLEIVDVESTINPSVEGLSAKYSRGLGVLTLSGSTEKIGRYSLDATVKFKDGRQAKAPAVAFEVISGEVKLSDRLTLDRAQKSQDGYDIDLSPATIKLFGGDNETVVVPREITNWYGSRQAGIYGEIGYPVPDKKPTQKLIIPSGSRLTMHNVYVNSSVTIVVQDRAQLNLDETSVHGVIVVEKGGKFSMNYDFASQRHTKGSSINGQLQLHDGSTLLSSNIYSNTNSLSNGRGPSGIGRENRDPVVVSSGMVSIDGSVWIRGDKAPGVEGEDSIGQPAMQVVGQLSITKGSLLAVLGGGRIHDARTGGTGIIFKDAKVIGEGKLVALGGIGTVAGGDAVIGNACVANRDAYLEGGSVNSGFAKDQRFGKAKSEMVVLANHTNRALLEGSPLQPDAAGNPIDSKKYWLGSLGIGDPSIFVVPANAPGGPSDSDNPCKQPDPDPSGSPVPPSGSPVPPSESPVPPSGSPVPPSESPAPPSGRGLPLPDTGDGNVSGLVGVLLVVAGSALLVARRLRN